VLRHPSLKHRATMPLALSMALAWYTTTLPQPQSFIIVLLRPCMLCATFLLCSFYVPCAPSSLSMFLYCCLFYVRAPCVVSCAPRLYLGGIHAHLSVSCRHVADRCRSLWLGQMVRSFMRMRCAPSSSVPTVSQRSSGSPSRAARTPPRVWPRQPAPLHPRQRP